MKDFCIEKKIYYHDTDCGGVVYYANYLKYLEEARSEYCLNRGIDLKAWVEEGIYFVVARVAIDYKAPAKYQDKIAVSARIEKTGASSICFFQEILRGGVVLASARITWVCVGSDFKSRRIPEEVKGRI